MSESERTKAGASAETTPTRTKFQPPAWLRLLSNLPLILGCGILIKSAISEGGGTAAVSGVLVALMLAFIVRSFQLKIAVGSDVTVVNWRGTAHYQWSDVVRFEHDRAGLWLVRRSTERVAVKAFAFGRALPPVQREGKAVAAELEALRKAHRGPGTARNKKRRRR